MFLFFSCSKKRNDKLRTCDTNLAFKLAAEKCNLQRSCKLRVNQYIFDPKNTCSGISKYLVIQYRCVEPGKFHQQRAYQIVFSCFLSNVYSLTSFHQGFQCQLMTILDSNIVGFCFGNYWSDWQNSGSPNKEGENELLSDHLQHTTSICPKPSGFEIAQNSQIENVRWNTYVLRHSVQYGLSCRNSDQNGKRLCRDFKVRYCCSGRSKSKYSIYLLYDHFLRFDVF